MKRNSPGTWKRIMALAVLLGVPAGALAQGGEAGAVTPAAAPAAEEALRPTFTADFGVFSQYVWRGYALSRDSAVFQPSFTVEYWGFSLNLWGNLDMGVPGSEDYPPWNETDLTVAYDRSFGPVDVGVGYIYYGLHGAEERDSQEVYVSVGVDTLLSPSFSAYREIAYYPGWYLNLGVSHSLDLIPDRLSAALGASFGYMDPDGGGGYFNDAAVSLEFTVPIGQYFTLTPMVAYTFYLSGKSYDELRAGSVDGKADHIYGGATLSVSF
jgi:uncharacterized protein (TIGR02001 family)